jgi:hypothetical protein
LTVTPADIADVSSIADACKGAACVVFAFNRLY